MPLNARVKLTNSGGRRPPLLAAHAGRRAGQGVKGTKPGELPIEQSTKCDPVINRKTAKTIRLTIPPSVLLRADQVIE
jgi:putative ABC transport system substrate-binding protein